MPDRLVGVLESYDFFGKSIPGILLLIGFFTFLPKIPLFPVGGETESINFATITTLALTLVFSGLVLGQAVHTVAVNIEKVFYRVGWWLLNRYYVHSPLVLSDEYRESHPRVDGIYKYCRPWLIRRYWGIHDTFKSHRRLFENELGWYFDLSVEKRKSDVPNVNYDTFRQHCKSEFDVDVARFDQTSDSRRLVGGYEQLRHLYPMVTSKTANATGGRASGFQARYSFCRGMWVVLLILLLGYLWLQVLPAPLSALDYKPVILDLFSSAELGVLMFGLVVAIIVFLDAAGDYKRHYIEYLIADFNSLTGTDNKKQKDKQEGEKKST
jgi:hypothetical protein